MTTSSNTTPSMTAGVDEAGRGPLAGPVAVAAVILGHAHDWSAVDDSKKLSEAARDEIADVIKAHALHWEIVLVNVATIDRVNIFQATMMGMREAVLALGRQPELVLIDGNKCPELPMQSRAIVGGDASEKCIGAASILAKQARDQYMIDLDQQYPGYGFARHKGYPTSAHFSALRELGPTPEHRRSFAPVREQLQGQLWAT